MKYAKNQTDEDSIFNVEEIISNLVRSTEYDASTRQDHYALLRQKFNPASTFKVALRLCLF